LSSHFIPLAEVGSCLCIQYSRLSEVTGSTFFKVVLNHETVGTLSALMWKTRMTQPSCIMNSCGMPWWCISCWNWADAHCGLIVLWYTGLTVYPS